MAAFPTISVFSSMYNALQSTITTSTSSFGNGLAGLVVGPLTMGAVVYFLILGFGVMRGVIQTPLKELAWQIGKTALVFMAAGATFYSSVIVSGVPAISTAIISAGSGTEVSNAGALFDTYVNEVGQIGQAILDPVNKEILQSQGFMGALTGAAMVALVDEAVAYACIILLYIFAGLSGLIGFVIIAFALLGTQICVALAPLAFASLLFPSSRFFFDGWLRQTLNYSLLNVIMSIVTGIITTLIKNQIPVILQSLGATSMVSSNAIATVIIMVNGVILYCIGTIFFFETPSIAAGIVGGTASGGHGVLQAGLNRAVFGKLGGRKLGGGGAGGSGAKGGSIRN
ncbi:type IV secretion system protein [Novosphingobium acidiphilum]|uniref:type IV secretion system protein n=1 Tax=Novosphingobium acidiphilum TaxID=505248 RepID=UPI000A05C3B3|nr:type IV secretion system protein [Novosphingobium acidiphilum]